MTLPASATFQPGPGVAIVGDRHLLVVEDRDGVDVSALLAAGTQPDALDALVAELTRGGVRHAPPFAMVIVDGGAATVLVRGTGSVRCVRPDGSVVEIDAEGVATWVEETVHDVATCTAWLDATRPDPALWQVARGVVPATAVHGWVPAGVSSVSGSRSAPSPSREVGDVRPERVVVDASPPIVVDPPAITDDPPVEPIDVAHSFAAVELAAADSSVATMAEPAGLANVDPPPHAINASNGREPTATEPIPALSATEPAHAAPEPQPLDDEPGYELGVETPTVIAAVEAWADPVMAPQEVDPPAGAPTPAGPTPADSTVAAAAVHSAPPEPPAPAASVAPLAAADAPGEDAEGFDFGHLLEHTMYFGAEAAAVRSGTEPEIGAVSSAPVVPPVPPIRPIGDADPNLTLMPVSDGPLYPGAGAAHAGPWDDAGPAGFGSAGLIDAVPGASHRAPAAQELDMNATLTDQQLRALLGHARPAPPPDLPAAEVPSVPAVRCPARHLNPPEADRCRECGAPITTRAIDVVPRPSLGRLTFDTGQVVDLVRPLLVGRKPPTGEAVNGEIAGTVVIADPEQMLSRLHLEIRLEGWQVLVVDRRSVNATYVTLPGKPQLQLRPGEPYPIVPGSKVSLGEIVSFDYELDRS